MGAAVGYVGLIGAVISVIANSVCVIKGKPLLIPLSGLLCSLLLVLWGMLFPDDIRYSILCSIFSTAIVSVIVYLVIYRDFKISSARYLFLTNLPKEISGEPLHPVYTYQKNMNSKAQLERMNVDVQMMNVVSSEESLRVYAEQGAINQGKQRKYQDVLSFAPPYEQKKDFVFRHIEKNVCSRLEQEKRPIVPSFTVIFQYTSPMGRNHYQYSRTFSLEEIQHYIRKCNDVNRYKQTAQYQRSLMTDSLRYDIMKRDGFRCVLCGRSAQDGVSLHVDHILPVSKGGKTEPSNLWTLCEQCNLGKGEKYDRFGPN